jgi:hypothetical protein
VGIQLRRFDRLQFGFGFVTGVSVDFEVPAIDQRDHGSMG